MRLHARHHREDGGLEPIYLNGFQSQCRSLRFRALASLAAAAAEEELGGAARDSKFLARLSDAGLVIEDGRGPRARVPLLLSELAHAAAGAESWLLAVAAGDSADAALKDEGDGCRQVWLFVAEDDEAVMSRRLQALSALGAVRADLDDAYSLDGEALSSGASATVHLARQRWPECAAEGAPVVAKVFSWQRKMAQVHQEVSMLLLAQGHPSIVRYRGLFFRHGREVLLTELCRGGDLFEQVAAGGVYAEGQALDLVGGVFSALAHVHDVGVVHRDVNPQNVLITPKGEPLLTDFGIAALCSDALAMETCCGTPGYTAPEVFLPGRYGQKVDVFSAGALLFFLLFAPTPLFKGRSLKEVRSETVECRVRFPHQRRIGQAVRDFLLALLARAPRDRPTAELAVQMLELMQQDDVERCLHFDDVESCLREEPSACGRASRGEGRSEGGSEEPSICSTATPSSGCSSPRHSPRGSYGSASSPQHGGSSSSNSIQSLHLSLSPAIRKMRPPRGRPALLLLLLPLLAAPRSPSAESARRQLLRTAR